MGIAQLLFIAAAIAFALDAFHVSVPAISWTPLGFCFLTIAIWLVG
jgi:hypothetical protein